MGRKDEILDILTQKFQEEGFTMDLTLSQIADKLEIGKSTIYEYFKSKDQIYKEAILRIIQSHIDDTLRTSDTIEGFEANFKYFLKRLIVIAAKSRMMMEVLTRNFMDKLPDDLREELKDKMETTRADVEAKFKEVFMLGVTERVIVGTPNIIKQELITSLVIGSVVRYSDQYNKIDVDQFVSEIFKYVIIIANE